MTEMSDAMFLTYCRVHCDTPRAAFVPKNIARLLRLAGYIPDAERWEKKPNSVLDGYRGAVLTLLDEIDLTATARRARQQEDLL